MPPFLTERERQRLHALGLEPARDPIEHELKIWPPFFEHLVDRRKRFDVRKNDRGYAVGDTIKFREWVPREHGHAEPYYTGRNYRMRIRYILDPRPDRDPDCGLVAGYVVLDVEPVVERS